MDGTVIVADDDKNLRTVLTQSLTRAGAKVRATATIATLWRWLEEGEGDVVLCDVNMADGDALEVLPKMRALRPEIQFVMMSAQNTVITALRAQEAGAFDYLAKPFDLRDMIASLTRAQKQIAKPKVSAVPESEYDLPLVGRSEAMQEIYRKLAKIIPSDLPVLITGETGTGKSLVADVIHRFGPRKSANLVRYDGANYRENSVADAFRAAEGGSLILEKLDDYLPSEQREILQAIESAKYAPRLISTASPNLAKLVEEGRFRADLYHFLQVLTLELPMLKERTLDIADLAKAFIHEETDGRKLFDASALENLQSRSWHGNSKELRSLVRRIAAMVNVEEITARDLEEILPKEFGAVSPRTDSELRFSSAVEAYVRRFMKLHGDHLPPHGIYDELIDQLDRPVIEVVLEFTGGNQIKTAEILGINRNTLRKKIQNLDISVTKGKKMM